MEVSASMVMALRNKTGLSMMDCKKALVESNGDEATAIEWLRKAGVGKIEKLAGRTASEGRIACHLDPASGRGGIAELRCETAPVANTADFSRLTTIVARLAALSDNPTPEALRAMKLPDNPGRTLEEEWTDVVNRLRENMQIARVASLKGHVGSYVHHNSQVGVLIEMSTACPDAVKTDVCMHVAAMRPPYVTRDQVPAADVQREREAAAESAKGKPAPVVEKIVSGKLDRWYGECVLLDQPFVKDDKQSVGAYLGKVASGLTVRRVLRYEVGAE